MGFIEYNQSRKFLKNRLKQFGFQLLFYFSFLTRNVIFNFFLFSIIPFCNKFKCRLEESQPLLWPSSYDQFLRSNLDKL